MKILLTGGSGNLGSEILKIYDAKNLQIVAPSSEDLNILSKPIIVNNFDIIIHAAALTNTVEAESNFSKANKLNVLGTMNMLDFAKINNSKFVYISTDYVFDGLGGPYSVGDKINPISNYAKSKAAGEMCSLAYDNSVILRTSFCPSIFPYEKAFDDQWTSRDYVDIIAPMILNASVNFNPGIYHIGTERKTVYDLALRRKFVYPIKRSDVKSKVDIPRDTSFRSEDSEEFWKIWGDR